MRNVLRKILPRFCAAAAAILVVSPGFGADIQIKVTNDQAAGGFGLAPVWFGVQNGSFSTFTAGSTASSQIATLSQFGNTAPLTSLFAGNGPQTTLTSGQTVAQFLPGQSNSTVLTVANPSVDQYLSYAGMVVPSNDFFMGNANPLQIFDSSGKFMGPLTITVYGADVWDSDTEAQSNSVALTFIAGQTPGTGTQISNGAVTTVLSEMGGADFLQSIVGLTTGAGYQISQAFGSGDPIATIQISSVPEPTSVLMLGLGMAGIVIACPRLRSRMFRRSC
jgi:hypothetical protein